MKHVRMEPKKNPRGRSYSYCLRWEVADPNGKLTWKQETIRGTKDQAERRKQEIEVEINSGLAVYDHKFTLAGWLDYWLENCCAKLKPKTVEHYGNQIGYVREHPIADAELKKLTPRQLDQYLAAFGKRPKRRGKGTMASGSVGHAWSVLHNSLGRAERLGEISVSPMRRVDRPKSRPVKCRRALTLVECQQYAEAADRDLAEGKKAGVLIHLALDSGFRREDIAGLNWSAIDLDTGRIEISRVLVDTKAHGVQFQEPKTPAGERVVFVSKKTCAALRLWRDQLAARQRELGALWEDHDLVFPSMRPFKGRIAGRPASPSALLVALRGFQKRHPELACDVCLHELRHTSITNGLRPSELGGGGLSPVLAAARAGHRDARVTLRIYNHVHEDVHARMGGMYDHLLGFGTGRADGS